MQSESSDAVLPEGMLTFLFTDIEGSTRLWERDADRMRVAQARHDLMMQSAIHRHDGRVFKMVGDGFCAVFVRPVDALHSVLAAQQSLLRESWPENATIKVRMAVHTGTAELRDGEYSGPTLNKISRLLSTAHGGQSLFSGSTYECLRAQLPETVSLRDLGTHRLRDIVEAEQVYQLRHPDLPASFPPIKSLSTHPNNLPRELTSFIGRETQQDTVETLLASTRLLTLTGPGGSGKTRLCIQIAARVLDQFADGAWLIELAPLTSAALLLQTVATQLGVRDKPGNSTVETLLEHLRDKHLLLVLDNCEHVLEEAAKFTHAVVRHCADVKILCSSREALGVGGEQIFPVPALTLPDRSIALATSSLQSSESIRLFTDRAALVRPDFRVTDENAAALVSLCWQLDGIPLAIELAAAKMRNLSVDDIGRRLRQRFRVLTGGPRTAMPRQQKLSACIDWSYDLLDEVEQRSLQRLSAFSGGWTLEAAEEICAGEGIDPADVIDLLGRLCDKSLAIAEPLEEHLRYRLLETIRQYARQKLEDSGDAARVRSRHHAYFLGLAEEGASVHIRGGDVRGWTRFLQGELDNLRAALEGSLLDPGEREVSLRFCGALSTFWWRWGRATEGRDWCGSALARSPRSAFERARLGALLAEGTMLNTIGDLTRAKASYEEALLISRRIGDLSREGMTLRAQGNVELSLGNTAASQACYQRSIDIHRQIDEPALEAVGLNSLAALFINDGNLSAAEAPLERVMLLSRELGSREQEAYALSRLGAISQYQSNYVLARERHTRALEIAREVGVRILICEQTRHLGEVAVALSDLRLAASLLDEALTISQELSSWFAIRECLEVVAELATRQREIEVALQLWGAVETMRRTMLAPRFPIDEQRYQASVRECRSALGDDTCALHLEAGRLLDSEAAIRRALQWLRASETATADVGDR